MGETLLIINGRILTMAGKVLPGGCVLIENGKIAAVTDQIKIPEGRDTEVIDASGCLVMPGLVEAHCHVGITEEKKGMEGDDCNENVSPITPWLRALDAVNTMDAAFDDAVRAGITSIMVGPGSSNIVGGQFIFIKTKGRRIDDLIVKEPAAMKIAFGENPKVNFAEDHPARDMQDTFFIESHPDVLLRTHTSSVQSRVMEVSQPPIRIICPGRVYRNEAISYRAHCFFHQVEALYVDRDVSFTDLKQVLLLFAKEMCGADTKIRLRPSYFPFTEPSAEMDISCNICGGKGCPFCKHTGWVEILGCGMVDPNVLDANGIDSKVYSGYALGMGIERITNLKYQVKDLRMFSENDTRFLKEFEAAY